MVASDSASMITKNALLDSGSFLISTTFVWIVAIADESRSPDVSCMADPEIKSHSLTEIRNQGRDVKNC